jgi:hypothetical protein
MNEFRRCRFCGAVVLFDDARQVAAHEAPPCAGWSELLARMVAAGLMGELSPELHEVPDDLPARATGLAPSEPGNGKEKDN